MCVRHSSQSKARSKYVDGTASLREASSKRDRTKDYRANNNNNDDDTDGTCDMKRNNGSAPLQQRKSQNSPPRERHFAHRQSEHSRHPTDRVHQDADDGKPRHEPPRLASAKEERARDRCVRRHQRRHHRHNHHHRQQQQKHRKPKHDDKCRSTSTKDDRPQRRRSVHRDEEPRSRCGHGSAHAHAEARERPTGETSGSRARHQQQRTKRTSQIMWSAYSQVGGGCDSRGHEGGSGHGGGPLSDQCSTSMVAVSAPVVDAGNKYVQRVGRWTPSETVVPLGRLREPRGREGDQSYGRSSLGDYDDDDSRHGGDRSQGRRSHVSSRTDGSAGEGIEYGVRMEDYAVVRTRVGSAGPESNQCVLAVVADGHGSVPMVGRHIDDRDSDGPTVFVGGPECACLAATSMTRYIDRVGDFVSLPRLTPQGMAYVLRDAFAFAQSRCVEETLRGAVEDGARLGGTLGTSAIDGAYFERVARDAHRSLVGTSAVKDDDDDESREEEPAGGRSGRQQPTKAAHARPLVVVDKVCAQYTPTDPAGRRTGPDGRVVYYVSAGGQRALAEFGTTLTAVLAVPIAPSDGQGCGACARLFVAHAGDSDAFLFRQADAPSSRGGGRRRYAPFRLTLDHTISDASEVARATQHGLVVTPPHFRVAHGPEAGQALMPSRALGHLLMTQHGISSTPSVVSALLCPGDIVVLASDGLWGAYGLTGGWDASMGNAWLMANGGGATARTSPSAEDRSAARVAALLDGLPAQTLDHPDGIAHAILDDLIQHVTKKRDNAAIVVLCAKRPASQPRSGLPAVQPLHVTVLSVPSFTKPVP